MTNIIFFRHVFRDETTSGSETDFSVADNDDESGAVAVSCNQTIDGLQAKAAGLSAIRMNCFGFLESAAAQEDSSLDVIENDVQNGETSRLTIKNNPPNNLQDEQVAAGWPLWLSSVASEAIQGWNPLPADNYMVLDQMQRNVRSNIFKAIDVSKGEFVALKDVNFDRVEPGSVRSMAREILILRRLNHPNVIKLKGLVMGRLQYHRFFIKRGSITPTLPYGLYLVFEYSENDLSDLTVTRKIKFTEPQVKCYMHQLLSGIHHCHERGVLHRNILRSHLLLNNSGVLKIAGFGSASFLDPNQKQPMTHQQSNKLWYQSPELLSGATDYGARVDLWSTGCILAELLSGNLIIPRGSKELIKIFELYASLSKKYCRKSNPPLATKSKFQCPCRQCIAETFKDFRAPSLTLIESLLEIEPVEHKTATAHALRSEFFTDKPYACEPSSLPKYPPKIGMDERR